MKQIPASVSVITMAEIIRRVGAARGFTPAEMVSERPTRALAWARHQAMYEMRAEGLWSLRQIARALNLKDHTTIRYGIAAHSKRLGLNMLVPPTRWPRPPQATGSLVLSIEGNQDGIRMGRIQLDGKRYAFFHDRLNNIVRLFKFDRSEVRRVTEKKPALVALAKAMLEAAQAMEAAPNRRATQ